MRLKNITKIYHNKNNSVVALNDISIDIPSKGLTFILGASGCGKTTLLNIMSGKDDNFEGSIECNGTVESITQEAELFENLSVLDNLLLVSDDRGKIEELLLEFKLNQPHKKVKKLSVGEKKRVQIIRSLISKSNYLLCDEPTAALDYNNSELVMHLLKEVSKEMSVIVVTHRIALVDQYADNIIRMGKGCILDIIETNPQFSGKIIESSLIKRNKMKQFKTLLKMMQSRWQENIFLMIVSYLAIFSIFVGLFLFPSLNTKVIATNNWLNGKNVIITQPQEENYFNRFSQNNYYYYYYDLYEKEDIYFSKENIEGLIGYTFGWRKFNNYHYEPEYYIHMDSSFTPKINVSELRGIVNQYKDEYLKSGVLPFRGYDFMYNDLVFIDEEFPSGNYPENHYIIDYLYDYSNCLGFRTEGNMLEDVVPQVYSIFLLNQLSEIVPYQLFEGVTLDLVYGEMPKQLNEIVITKTVAEVLMNELEFNSIEDLVGQEVTLCLLRSIDSFSMYRASEEYPVVISGITYVESQYEKQVFFMDGGFENILVDMFEYNPDIVKYVFINFLTDPLADSEAIAKQLDLLLESKESNFMVYNSLNLDAAETYQEPGVLSVFVIFSFATLLAIYLIMQIMLNKRICKENGILERYNYHPLSLQILKMMILLVFVAILQVNTLGILCNYLNTMANNMGFADIVSYDMFIYLKSFILMTIIVVLWEGGLYAIRIKKHS